MSASGSAGKLIVKTLPLPGVLFTLIGSFVGERIQMGPPPKSAD